MRMHEVDGGSVSGTKSTPESEQEPQTHSIGKEDCGLRERLRDEEATAINSSPEENSGHLCSRRMGLGPSLLQGGVQAEEEEGAPNLGSMAEEDSKRQEHPVKQKAATSKELMGLLLRQEKRCALSGLELTIDSMELGHITPVCEGGSDAIDNLMWIDSRINRMQGTMSIDEFVRLCRMVAQWNA